MKAILTRAYTHSNIKTAKRLLQDLARRVDPDYPRAAASVREGLDDTLTVLGLGLSERLPRSLATTNAIESLLSRPRQGKRNVKRWRGGTMVLRWVAAEVLEATTGFHRVNGGKDMPALVAALRARDVRLGLGEWSEYGCVVVNRAAAEFQQRTGQPQFLGHSKIQTTARYAHLARDAVKESAARVAAKTRSGYTARRLRDGCRRDSSVLRPDSDVRGESARGERPGPKRLRRFARAGSILSWSGRVASAGISLNRRSRPGSPVGASSLGPALKLPGDREESRGGNPVTAGW